MTAIAILPESPDAAILECPEFATKMEPHEFKEEFPVTYAEMAELCCCSEDLVKHWFSTGKGSKKPKEHHKVILAYVYREWKHWESEPVYSREIYERVQKRKQDRNK